MTSETINDFLVQKKVAVVGVSLNKRKFGTIVYHNLVERGLAVYAVNPGLDSFEGERCYPSLTELPEPVGGAVIVVPPAQTEKVVQEAAKAGITRLWMQQGAESKAAIEYCEQNGIAVVFGKCILMHSEPVRGIHKFHRAVNKIFGKS